ncbi:transposable element Tc1 transposase [Trichonephila clavipes]|nr:transposable element Tc1 transposase [Trichonephila clavipes]
MTSDTPDQLRQYVEAGWRDCCTPKIHPKLLGFCAEASSYAAEQFHSDVSLEAVDRRAPNNSKNWQWTTEGDVSARRSTPSPHNRTVFSRQFAAFWSPATGVLMSASSIRRRLLCRELRVRVPLYRIPLTANHRWLRLQWAYEHRARKADWHQVVFSDESRLNLWDHDGLIRVIRCAGERCLPEYIIE